MAKSGRVFLLTTGCVLAALLVFSFWTVRSNKAAGSFEVHNVVLREEVEANGSFHGGNSRFVYGIRQICLRFDFARATGGDSVQVQWFFRGHPIHSESIRLPSGDGSKTLCLLQEEGFPLPSGPYSVGISVYDKVLSDMAFEIVRE